MAVIIRKTDVKHRTVQYLPLLLLMLLSGAIVVAGGREADDRTRLKAEYIYLEASNTLNSERYDDYYMQLRHAHRLNPDDPYILGSLAEIEIALPGIDSAGQERSYRAIAERFRLEPTNQRYTTVYANLAQQARRIDDLIEIWTLQDSLRPDRSDPAFNLAGAYTARYSMRGDSADLDSALAIYSRLERGLGHTLAVTGRKINIFLATGDTASVLDEVRLLELDAPRDIDTKLYAASLYDHLGYADSALVRYERAADIEPDNGKVYLARANYFRQQGDSARYDTEVFRALESPTLEFAPKFQLLTDYVTKLYADSAQWPRIDRMFALMEDDNAGEADFHALYAGYKAEKGETAEAAEQLSYTIDLDPSHSENWVDLVQLYVELGDTVAADTASRRAMELFPENGYFPLIVSSMMLGRGQDSLVLAMIDTLDVKAYKNDRVASALYSTKGDVLWHLGRTADATAAYREAIVLNPENYMAMNNFAYFCACEGVELSAAQLYASVASTAEPENISFIDTYAWVMFKRENYVRAKELIDKALELLKEGDWPESTMAEVYEHAGDICSMTGDTDRAMTFWKKANALKPSEALKLKMEFKMYLKDVDQ